MSAVLDPRGGALPLPFPPHDARLERDLRDLREVRDASALRAPTVATPRRGTGLAIVVVAHVGLAWAITSGLAKRVVDVVRAPAEVTLAMEQPPPPPPPKVEKLLEPPKASLPPPPVYVPPPEVVVAAAPAPTVAATSVEPPPAPPPAAIAPPAPVPAPPAPKPVLRQEASLACPGYQAVLSQTLEEAFERVGVTGVVRTRLTVRGNDVVDAVPVSGPKEYYKFVQAAVRRIHCSAGGAEEVQVNLDVKFAG